MVEGHQQLKNLTALTDGGRQLTAQEVIVPALVLLQALLRWAQDHPSACPRGLEDTLRTAIKMFQLLEL